MSTTVVGFIPGRSAGDYREGGHPSGGLADVDHRGSRLGLGSGGSLGEGL